MSSHLWPLTSDILIIISFKLAVLVIHSTIFIRKTNTIAS